MFTFGSIYYNMSVILLLATTAFQFTPTPGTSEYAWLREAEKKHSRVALLAVPALATIAVSTGQDPVPWLNEQPITTQLIFYSAAGLIESINLRRFDKGFTLKQGEIPGRVLPVTPPAKTLDAFEDASGRVAMLAVAATLARSVL